MSDSDADRKLAKLAKKEKKRKLEEETAAAAAEEEDRAAKKAKKEAKKAKKAAEESAATAAAEAESASIAAIEADIEKGAAKRHKKERRSRSPPPAAASSSTVVDGELTPEEEKARKKAKKALKRANEEAILAESTRALEAAREEEDAEIMAAAAAGAETDEQRAERKKAKKEKKAREAAAAASGVPASQSADAAASAAPAEEPKRWPTPPPGNVTLLLFYQYVRPSWSTAARQQAENFARDSLNRHGCTGRLRCAREGFNATLTGPHDGMRAFCQDLREYQPENFANTDFKLTDGLRENQMLRGLKVWHVDELVTYGFGANKGLAPIESGGTHLKPIDWHNKAAEDNTVLIDVRNANENAIGRFQPLNDASRVLDPYMRVSTEFPQWVDDNMDKLKKAKNIMMYCTGGIRCERASALLVQKGLPTDKVFQLEGGIHKYLEHFPDGGHWVGKNYVFDRRFAHGATTKTPEVVGRCACCAGPWDRYQASKKCFLCRMEVLVCRECERSGKFKTVKLKCFLCGGPKPSYLPEDEKINKPRAPKHYTGKGESEY